MLYEKNLLEYLKHFGTINVWIVNKEDNKVEGFATDLDYNATKYYLTHQEPNKIYEVHTRLNPYFYLKNSKVLNGYGVAIDIDLKDRDNGISLEFQKDAKETANHIIEFFEKNEIKYLYKFSGSSYHILLFFSSDINFDYINQKTIDKIFSYFVKDYTNEYKSKVKDIEVKKDAIRSLFSYNSKYGNYSVPTTKETPVEDDIKNSKEEKDFELDYNSIVNEDGKSIEKAFISYSEKERINEEKRRKYLEIYLKIDNIVSENNIDSKDITINEAKTSFVPNKEISLIFSEMKEAYPKLSEEEIYNYLLNYFKNKQNMSFYDEILNKGVKDGIKRLIYSVVVPMIYIKNKDKTKKELIEFVKNWIADKCNINRVNLYKYNSIIESSVKSVMASKYLPISKEKFFIMFGVDNEYEFKKMYLNE
jgi:hypothetical protein